jgi:hypothetical protein
MIMRIRETRKPMHPARTLQTAVNGLFAAVFSGHKTREPLPSFNTDDHDPDVLTDGSRNLILGEMYLQHRG